MTGSSKCCSMYRHTDLTNSCLGFPVTDFGRQRRHSRNPALSASCGARKNVTFSRRGRFEGQDGLQYIPVEETAKTNFPSLALSRANIACHRASSVMGVMGAISSCPIGCASKLSIALFMIENYIQRSCRAVRILRSN